MIDKYINKKIQKIRINLHDKKFSLISEDFRELVHYGITLENSNLVLLSSELTDVFFSSLALIEEFKEDIDQTEINNIIDSIDKLIDFLLKEKEELNEKEKAVIYDLLSDIIYTAEKIQYQIEGFEKTLSRRMRYTRFDVKP